MPKGNDADLLLRKLGHVTLELFAEELLQRGRREIQHLGVGFALVLVLVRLGQRGDLCKRRRKFEGGDQFFTRSGWFCSPQWLVMAPAVLSLRFASFFCAPLAARIFENGLH